MEELRSHCSSNRPWIFVDLSFFAVLLVLYAVAEFVWKPVNRIFIIDDPTISYPYTQDESVPTWLLLFSAMVIPFVVILVVSTLQGRGRRDHYTAIFALCLALVVNGIMTDAIKNSVGRHRPDFMARCQYNATTELCDGDSHLITEGRKSFPSGHASTSFAGLGYLAFYLAGKSALFDGTGRVWKHLLFFAPLLGALLIALSRVHDYRHHWQDVLVGGLLGLFFAYFFYRQYYPRLDHVEPALPLSSPLSVRSWGSGTERQENKEEIEGLAV